jgi:hypothetical protein
MSNYNFPNFPHGLTGYVVGKGFGIYGRAEPVPLGDAVEMATQILGIAAFFGDWRPSPEQRARLANFLSAEDVGDIKRIAAAT